jgi:hypothetical protein
MAYKIGQRLTLKTDGGYGVATRNDVGGTEKIPDGEYDVIVIKAWWDYETGDRYHGQVVKQADVDRIAAATATPYTPKSREYDPSLVFFSDDVVIKGGK